MLISWGRRCLLTFSFQQMAERTQTNFNDGEFLISSPFSFTKVFFLLQMSESLAPQDSFPRLNSIQIVIVFYQLWWLWWIHIPWKSNLKWIQSVQWRLRSHNRPNRRLKCPLTCITARFYFFTLNHTASYQRAWARRSDLNVSHCQLGTTGPCVWAGCADGSLFRSSSSRCTARLMEMMMIHTFLIFKAPLFSLFLDTVEICVKAHKRFKPNLSPSPFRFSINDFTLYTPIKKKKTFIPSDDVTRSLWTNDCLLMKHYFVGGWRRSLGAGCLSLCTLRL